MRHPIGLVLQSTESSADIEMAVFEAIEELERFCDQMTGCHVLVRGPSAEECVYTVTLKVRTPDREVAVAAGRADNPVHRDVKTTVHEAFARAKSELRLLRCSQCSCSVDERGQA
ncbi:MAG TPA: hypothetical protein VHK24_10580 [Steroidobacter sp.]|jgi:hypothetical protein|nr:hypothetical protein [Steroidobacter sp.]